MFIFQSFDVVELIVFFLNVGGKEGLKKYISSNYQKKIPKCLNRFTLSFS
jgi:hypothetical protein